jgi:hypothetical protein
MSMAQTGVILCKLSEEDVRYERALDFGNERDKGLRDKKAGWLLWYPTLGAKTKTLHHPIDEDLSLGTPVEWGTRMLGWNARKAKARTTAGPSTHFPLRVKFCSG